MFKKLTPKYILTALAVLALAFFMAQSLAKEAHRCYQEGNEVVCEPVSVN